ncbi:MAG: hypothetical protein F6J90_41010 [Moorea sp. SIOASIH]|nr:hypothetical protein [Moorena sp. SIOASIH]
MGETTAVAHGGNPQDRAASPRPRCIAFISFPKICITHSTLSNHWRERLLQCKALSFGKCAINFVHLLKGNVVSLHVYHYQLITYSGYL